MREDWVKTELIHACGIHDNLRKPINNKERNVRIEGKTKAKLFPYYGATGQVGYIDDYLTDGDYLLVGEDAAPFYDYTKDVAYSIQGKTWVNNHAHILLSYFNNEFLKHYLNQFDYHGYVSGSTRLKLTQASLKTIPVKIAPLPEQRAIVAKIEQLFSELDNGIANLKTAQDKLEIYRQAVLKKAFEGELTKAWREQQTDLPSADELLEQIKLERQRHYEQQLADWEKAVETWEVNGKEGKKPKKPRPLDLSIRSDYESKLNTPFGWSECQVADIYNVLTDYHANGSYETLKEHVELFDEPSFAVMIRATNFEKNDFKENLKYISEDAYNFMSKSKLYGGEILIGKIGNAGRTYLMPNLNRKASLAMNLFALRINTINSKFFFYQLSSTCLKREISSYVKGVGNPTIDKKSVRSIHLNICSDKEQSQIVQEIESRLSVCDKLSDTIKEQLEKAEALRQSILKKAFEGRLLSDAEIEACKQEADWEPAEQLLARIKAEKVKA